MDLPAGKINLKVVPIAQLRPHEETVGRLSDGLGRSLVRDGVQRDPVVVDEATGIILDGMHRVESLKRMGARSVVAYLVDYADPKVRLYRWYRFVKRPGSGKAREREGPGDHRRAGPGEDRSPRVRTTVDGPRRQTHGDIPWCVIWSEGHGGHRGGHKGDEVFRPGSR